MDKYKYKACPFGEAKQDGTRLGSNSDTEVSDAGELMLKFTEGERCWNGPSRSLALTLKCGDRDSLESVEEPSRCEYSATLYTPQACKQSDVDALETVDHQLFEEVIWPALYERVPAFESLRVESSWAGLYEFCTLDQNAVVGWHPDASNLVVAAGFSGHGLQHAPGVGRAVAELIDSGGYESIDLACLDYGRVVSNEPLFEANVW